MHSQNVTISADVYSLGAVLIGLFGGKPILENVSSYTIMCQVTEKGAQPKIDHLPPSIQDIAKRCLCHTAMAYYIRELQGAFTCTMHTCSMIFCIIIMHFGTKCAVLTKETYCHTLPAPRSWHGEG